MGCGFRKVKLATPILGKCQHEKIAPDDFNPCHESSPNVIGMFLGPLRGPFLLRAPQGKLMCFLRCIEA